MNYKEKYTEETGQKPYCWTKGGQYVKSGSYSDGYVKWLEEQLSIYSVVVPKGTLCCEPKDYEMLDTGSVICKVCKKTIAI